MYTVISFCYHSTHLLDISFRFLFFIVGVIIIYIFCFEKHYFQSNIYMIFKKESKTMSHSYIRRKSFCSIFIHHHLFFIHHHQSSCFYHHFFIMERESSKLPEIHHHLYQFFISQCLPVNDFSKLASFIIIIEIVRNKLQIRVEWNIIKLILLNELQ